MSGALYRFLEKKGLVKLNLLFKSKVLNVVPGTVAGIQPAVLNVERETCSPVNEEARHASHTKDAM